MMRNAEFEIIPGTRVRVSAQETLVQHPVWLLDAVALCASPGTDLAGPAGVSTVGSSVETGDELRFDVSTNRLCSAHIFVPEENLDWEQAEHICEVPLGVTGVLELVSEDPFILPTVDLRAFDPGGSALVGLIGHAAGKRIERRFEVAPCLDLLCVDGQYVGWLLRNPVALLAVAGVEPADPSEALDDYARSIDEFFSLVNESTMDLLYDGDAELKNGLKSLRKRIAGRAAPSMRALEAKIADILDSWF